MLGQRRRAEEVTRVRAVWQDDDCRFEGGFPLSPSIVVATSPDKFQRYWLADGLTRNDFKALMAALVNEYGSDRRAADIARVLRLPGFFHHKADPYLVTIVEASGVRYGRDELLKAFPTSKKPKPESAPRQSASFVSSTHALGEHDTFRTKTALHVIDPDPYDTWIKVGQILHREYGGHKKGFCLWANWAQGSPKFDLAEHEDKWATFGKREGAQLGLGTLFWLAERALYGE
jgi:Primase C terminal 2 (PriCT-2)/RepB DNA-primase from phage plasmid